jgi:hypothetical protein
MAIAATAVWEVRTTGSDNNGGGFDSALGGTDNSMQTSAQVNINNSTVTATVNGSVITFTGGTYTVLAGDVGNIVNIITASGGTPPTLKRYEITSVGVGLNGTWTLDSTTSAVTSTITSALMGGCFATFGKAITSVVAGNVVYVKGTAIYSIAASTNFATSGTSGLPISWIGYTTSRGDNGQVTIQASTTAVDCFKGNGAFQRFYNFIGDGNLKGTSRGFNLGGGQLVMQNCKAINSTVTGFLIAGNQGLFISCVASGQTSAATGGFLITAFGNVFVGCRATANACPGVVDQVSSATANNQYASCIFDNNTGASSDGFQKTASGGTLFQNCAFYTNARDGLRISAAGGVDMLLANNNAFVNNTGVGINSTVTNWGTQSFTNSLDYNAFFGNSSPRTNVPAGTHDVTLTGDPFVNGASNNFALNNTAGSGAACRAAGFPGVLQSGGTGFQDIGGLQHLDSPAIISVKKYSAPPPDDDYLWDLTPNIRRPFISVTSGGSTTNNYVFPRRIEYAAEEIPEAIRRTPVLFFSMVRFSVHRFQPLEYSEPDVTPRRNVVLFSTSTTVTSNVFVRRPALTEEIEAEIPVRRAPLLFFSTVNVSVRRSQSVEDCEPDLVPRRNVVLFSTATTVTSNVFIRRPTLTEDIEPEAFARRAPSIYAPVTNVTNTTTVIVRRAAQFEDLSDSDSAPRRTFVFSTVQPIFVRRTTEVEAELPITSRRPSVIYSPTIAGATTLVIARRPVQWYDVENVLSRRVFIYAPVTNINVTSVLNRVTNQYFYEEA